MGIRTLHRRTTPAPAQATADQPPNPTQPPVATDASAARIPVDLTSTLRQTATTLGRRLAHRTQGWAELTRSYLALARTLLTRPHPAGAVIEPPDGSAPSRPHPNPHCQAPEPDATP